MAFPHKIKEYEGVSVIKCTQPIGIRLKIRGHKLISGVYWQEAYSYSTPALKWGGGQCHALATLPLGKQPSTHSYRGLTNT
jgi:hypothetical protein